MDNGVKLINQIGDKNNEIFKMIDNEIKNKEKGKKKGAIVRAKHCLILENETFRYINGICDYIENN